MKRKILLLSLIITMLCLPSCGSSTKENKKFQEVRFKVKTTAVREAVIKKTLSYYGTVEAFRKENIIPKITGKIRRIYVDEGEKVKEGQLLVELDSEQSEIQLKQAKAALGAAVSSLEDARKNYERGESLLKEEAISEQQFEKLQLAYKTAKAQKDQAKATVELAEFMIASSKLHAPFSGVITSKLKNEGDFINPVMGGFSGGSGILVLMDFSRVKVYVDVPSGKINLLRKGMQSYVVQGQRRVNGKIFSISQVADPASKTFKVGILAENEDFSLKPGTDADVKIVYLKKKAMAIPKSALIEGRYVFAVKNGIASKISIETGVEGDRMVEVLRGLRLGERIVVGNLFGLYDGAKVEEAK